eukprot:COSAG05_NODE_485_length_9349_cov_60.192865_5_plen_46_part_00
MVIGVRIYTYYLSPAGNAAKNSSRPTDVLASLAGMELAGGPIRCY